MAVDLALLDLEQTRGNASISRFSRRIAITIAIVSLLAAVVGWLQNQANTQAGNAAQQAQAHAIEAADATVRAREQQFASLDTWVLGLEGRVTVANLASEIAFAPADQQATLQAARAAATAQADRTATLSGLDLTANDGPRTDASLIWAKLSSATRDRFQIEALQDADNELANAWGRQTASYNAMLAIVAVALYLLGLSLTLDVRRAKALVSVAGVALAVFAGGWTAVQTGSQPTLAPAAAADAYADGMVALAAASSQQDYSAAAAAFTKAIDARPTFARAYANRGTARLAAASPEQVFGGQYITLIPDAALAAGAADYEQAMTLGLDDTQVIWNLGAVRFHQALRGNPSLLDDSIRFSNQAVARSSDNPVPWFNLAIALLAAGRVDEAQTTYSGAIARVIWSDVGAQTPRGYAGLQMSMISSALTGLEVLRAAKPDLAKAIDAIQAEIVWSVGKGTVDPSPDTGAAVDGLAVDVFPSFLQWRGNLTGTTKDSTLATLWWYRGTDETAWSEIPTMSAAAVTPGVNPAGAANTHFGIALFTGITHPARCLPSGTYRVELYADGTKIGTAESNSPTAYTAFAARDIGAAFCHPANWTVSADSTLGLSAIAEGPDGDRGAGIIHLAQPSGGDTATVLRGVLDLVQGELGRRLGQTLTPASGGDVEGPVMSLPGLQRGIRYASGSLVLSAAIDTDGSAYATWVYGPNEWFTSGDWAWVNTSFRRLE